MSDSLKILMVGNQGCGKTALSNFLAKFQEQPSSQYKPTKGVRILEFDRANIPVGAKRQTLNVELWDCSGDRMYEGCWPAYLKDVLGVVFVFNPSPFGEEDKELEQWHKWFAQPSSLKDSQCLVFAHSKDSSVVASKKIPKCLSKSTCITTSLDANTDIINKTFDSFLSQIANAANEVRRREEDSLLG